MKMPHLVVFDLETGGLFPATSPVLQIAAQAYDPRTLDPIPPGEGGWFESLLKPLDESLLDARAMEVNRLPLDELRAAPHPEAVWHAFLAYVKRWNPKGLPTTAPIPAGKNIRNFDLPFIDRLSRQYSPRGEKQVVFNRREQVDLEDLIRHWFWHDGSLSGMAMDTLREHFGMSKDGAHRAGQDVRQTGAMITYFMKLTRELSSRRTTRGEPLLDFKAAFAGL